MAGLGLLILAALFVGAVLYFVLQAPGGRSAAAAEAHRTPHAPQAPVADDERGAAPVELVPAGSLPVSVATTTPSVAPAPQAAPEEPAVSALVAAPAAPAVEGPELVMLRGEGKPEIIKGKEERRERRSDRKERAQEAEATGVPLEQKKVAPPKANVDRSKLAQKKQKGEGGQEPTAPKKRRKPAPPPEGG